MESKSESEKIHFHYTTFIYNLMPFTHQIRVCWEGEQRKQKALLTLPRETQQVYIVFSLGNKFCLSQSPSLVMEKLQQKRGSSRNDICQR